MYRRDWDRCRDLSVGSYVLLLFVGGERLLREGMLRQRWRGGRGDWWVFGRLRGNDVVVREHKGEDKGCVVLVGGRSNFRLRRLSDDVRQRGSS